jgi:hypothetical protein
MSYYTDNIAIAAALKVHGYQISQIEIDGRRATFIFDDNAKEDASKIHLGTKLVDAISFHEQIRRLSGLARSMTQQTSRTD